MKVVIIEGHWPSLLQDGPTLEREVLGGNVEVVCFGEFPEAEARRHLPDADAVISRPGTYLGTPYVALLERCRVIVSLGVGVDHIDLAGARAKGIPVANVPDYGTEEVADSAVAMILSHYRRLGAFASAARRGEPTWDWRLHRPIRRASSQRVGIIGLGRIGTAAALRLKALGFQVGFYDPYLPSGAEKAVGLARHRDLRALVRESGIVSIHTPLTAETAGMIDRDFLKAMDAEGILVNVSRGKLFRDMDGVEEILRERPHFRVATDVWPVEPPDEHPLFKAWQAGEPWLGDRLIITPHAAFFSEEACRDLRVSAARIVATVWAGGPPDNVVN
jgi:D-3-phosphoglycerate dehydrogenase